MKKWLVIISCVIIILIFSLYLLIPSVQIFTVSSTVNCTYEAASRFLINNNKWPQWWPGEKKGARVYGFGNCDYKINKIMLESIDITVSNGKDSSKGILKITPDTSGLVKFQWVSGFSFSSNPVKRVSQFVSSEDIKTNINSLLKKSKMFFDKQENVYGMKIKVESVKDSSLVSYSRLLNHYPTTKEIYTMIGMVKEYVQKKGGKESDSPMMHVQTISTTEYAVMVAVPTISDLPSDGEFKAKKMILGNILTGDVKGGIYAVISGEQELKNFVTDFRRISPAISYQSLVTNRILEPDTSKWITRLYYPIF